MFVIQRMFIDTANGFYSIYQFVMHSHYDKNTQNLLREYNDKYLLDGWKLISNFIKVMWTWTCTLNQFKLSKSDPYYYHFTFIPITVIIVILILSELINKNQFMRDNILMVALFGYGIAVINANTARNEYSMIENWLVYFWFAQLTSIFMWISWKKIVWVHLIIMTIFVYKMYKIPNFLNQIVWFKYKESHIYSIKY